METKRAIIVGATSGIGYATTMLLISKGWTVGIAGRKEDVLISMKKQHPGIIAIQRIDITSDDATAYLMQLIEKQVEWIYIFTVLVLVFKICH